MNVRDVELGTAKNWLLGSARWVFALSFVAGIAHLVLVVAAAQDRAASGTNLEVLAAATVPIAYCWWVSLRSEHGGLPVALWYSAGFGVGGLALVPENSPMFEPGAVLVLACISTILAGIGVAMRRQKP